MRGAAAVLAIAVACTAPALPEASPTSVAPSATRTMAVIATPTATAASTATVAAIATVVSTPSAPPSLAPTLGPSPTLRPRPTATATPIPAPTPSTYALTVARTGDGGGKVTSFPEGISCGTTCTATFPAGSAVTLGTTPTEPYGQHRAWTGACAGTELGQACNVVMNGTKTVGAEFRHVSSIWLTLRSDCVDDPTGRVCGAGSSVGPGPFVCGVGSGNSFSCGFAYLPGETVELRAELTGTNLVTWTGCTVVDGTSCRVVLPWDPVYITFAVAPR